VENQLMKTKVLVLCIALAGGIGTWRMNAKAQGAAAATAELQALLNQGYEVKAAAAGSGDSSPALFLQQGTVVYSCSWEGRCDRWPRK
jgi:hypothetical protein